MCMYVCGYIGMKPWTEEECRNFEEGKRVNELFKHYPSQVEYMCLNVHNVHVKFNSLSSLHQSKLVSNPMPAQVYFQPIRSSAKSRVIYVP